MAEVITIPVKDPEYYHKAQHAIRGSKNSNDLHFGHETKIDKTGYWDGKHHYGVFVYVYNPITGSKSAVRAKAITN